MSYVDMPRLFIINFIGNS